MTTYALMYVQGEAWVLLASGYENHWDAVDAMPLVWATFMEDARLAPAFPLAGRDYNGMMVTGAEDGRKGAYGRLLLTG